MLSAKIKLKKKKIKKQLILWFALEVDFFWRQLVEPSVKCRHKIKKKNRIIYKVNNFV